MEVGNYLSPFLVFVVTLVFLRHLFTRLEHMQNELRQEKTKKIELIERDKLAKELHDGIAQSLFLLSVKMNKFNRKNQLEHDQDFQKMKQTLQHIHDDTRQAITNLKYTPNQTPISWRETINQFLDEIKSNHSINIHLQWHISEDMLTAKEKVELFACMKEAVMNVIKHANTNEMWINAFEQQNGWICQIKDRGIGFSDTALRNSKGYGLHILKNRAIDMNWHFSLERKENETTITLKKEQS